MRFAMRNYLPTSRIALALVALSPSVGLVAGWQRFNASSARQAPLLRLSAGGVTIASNPAAGCALWSWMWNGAEFINIRDYGREIQTSIGLLDRPEGGNPTEGGNRYFDRYILPAGIQPSGSACVLAANDLSWALSPTQRTLAVPLEWDPDQFGGSRARPVVRREFQLGKEITLNYASRGPVAEYQTVVVTQQPISKVVVEIPAVYLRGDLTRVELYDAISHTSSTLSVPVNRMSGTVSHSGWGGLIASTQSGTLAFGLYGVVSDQGGSVTRIGAGFQFGRFVDPGERPPYPPTSHTTTKINALAVGPLAAGRNTFRTFLISGARSEVIHKMDELAAAGTR